MHIEFEWDEYKNKSNVAKHGVRFVKAQRAFFDKKRIIHKDLLHSNVEKRFYCFGSVDKKILTVRFTYRDNRVRIIGAGYWNKGKKLYEKENNLH